MAITDNAPPTDEVIVQIDRAIDFHRQQIETLRELRRSTYRMSQPAPRDMVKVEAGDLRLGDEFLDGQTVVSFGPVGAGCVQFMYPDGFYRIVGDTTEFYVFEPRPVDRTDADLCDTAREAQS